MPLIKNLKGTLARLIRWRPARKGETGYEQRQYVLKHPKTQAEASERVSRRTFLQKKAGKTLEAKAAERRPTYSRTEQAKQTLANFKRRRSFEKKKLYEGERAKDISWFERFKAKRQWLKLGMLKHPEDKNHWYRTTKRGKGTLDYSKRVVIQDVVGFFQSTFLKAMDGMRGTIDISDDEQTLINWGKPLRGDFANQDMGRIIDYNRAEIVILARMMEAFRKALGELGLRPTRWHGPGVIAELELKRRTGKGYQAWTLPRLFKSNRYQRRTGLEPSCFQRRTYRTHKAGGTLRPGQPEFSV